MNEFGPVFVYDTPPLEVDDVELDDEDDDELALEPPPSEPIDEEAPFRPYVVSFTRPVCDATLNGPRATIANSRSRVCSMSALSAADTAEYGVSTTL